MNFASTLTPPLQKWCNWMISKLSKKLQGLGPTKALTWKYSKTRECNFSVCGWNESFKRTRNGIQGNATMMDKIQISSSWHTLMNKVCSSKWLARLAVALQYQKIMKILCKIKPALTTWNIVMLVNISRYVQHQSILHDPMGQKQKPLQWYYQLVSNHINWYQLSQL